MYLFLEIRVREKVRQSRKQNLRNLTQKLNLTQILEKLNVIEHEHRLYREKVKSRQVELRKNLTKLNYTDIDKEVEKRVIEDNIADREKIAEEEKVADELKERGKRSVTCTTVGHTSGSRRRTFWLEKWADEEFTGKSRLIKCSLRGIGGRYPLSHSPISLSDLQNINTFHAQYQIQLILFKMLKIMVSIMK